MGYITVETLEELAIVCAQLTREGIAFTAGKHAGQWRVQLTGY